MPRRREGPLNGRSSSSGFSLGIGPGGLSVGINGSRSSSQGAWTNTLGTLTSTNGTNVTVSGNTNLVGGGITSSNGQVNLSTGTLTASNLADSQTSQSASFGVTIGANPSFFLQALTAPAPGDVSAQGPAAETVYRQFIATGATQEQADAAVQTEQVQTAIQQQEITATYNGAPPQQALDVAGTGATVVQPDGMPQTMTVPPSLIPSADGLTLPDGSAPPQANPADTVQVANGVGADGSVTVAICDPAGGCTGAAVPVVSKLNKVSSDPIGDRFLPPRSVAQPFGG